MKRWTIESKSWKEVLHVCDKCSKRIESRELLGDKETATATDSNAKECDFIHRGRDFKHGQ